MKQIYTSLTILGIATALNVVASPVLSLTAPTPIVQNSAEDIYQQGLDKYSAEDLKGAIADYDQAIKLSPNNPEMYISRGNAYYDLGDKQKALVDYNQAIRLNPKYDLAYVERGNARDDLGDPKGAIQDYNQAIRLTPNFAAAYHNRGITYIRMRNRPAGLSDLQKAADLYKRQGNTAAYQKVLDLINRTQK